jgi:hypothetical protein
MDGASVIVPGFHFLNRIDRSACRTTIRDLAITSHPMALSMDPDTIITKLGIQSARDRNVRHRVRRFFLLCGRPTFTLPLPTQPASVTMAGVRHLSATQRTWLNSLFFDTFPVKFRRRVIAAIQILQVSSTEDVLACSTMHVSQCIMSQRNPKTAVTAVAQLFRLVNRRDTITMAVVRRHVNDGGLHLTKIEHQWLDMHPESVEEYGNLKRIMCATTVRLVRIQQAVTIMRHILEANDPACWIDTCSADPRVIVNATVCAIRASMNCHPLALGQRGRQTRRTNVAQGEPGMDLSVAYSQSAKFLISVALHQDPTSAIWNELLRPRNLYIQAECGSTGGSVGLMPVHDALSLAEMDSALQPRLVCLISNGLCCRVCITPRERLVILLLSRLGMRIGAICGLRLAGMLVGFDSLQPSPPDQVWHVRRFVSGRDKGGHINEWDTCFDSAVHVELESYINEVWRPRYAHWIERGHRVCLVNGYLFPSQYVTGHAERSLSVHTLSVMVKQVLARAGITGPHAHCHGFRKGLVTELLRAGNTLHAVSHFVHHRSTAITETCYDKRSYEEIVDRMILPMQWERSPASGDRGDEMGMDGTIPEQSHNGTADTIEQAACALREEMEQNNILTQQWLILRALLPDDAMGRYADACRQIGIPEKLTIPRVMEHKT